jgi:hypothetical protein
MFYPGGRRGYEGKAIEPNWRLLLAVPNLDHVVSLQIRDAVVEMAPDAKRCGRVFGEGERGGRDILNRRGQGERCGGGRRDR